MRCLGTEMEIVILSFSYTVAYMVPPFHRSKLFLSCP